jgi:hypothetical protein
MTNFMNLKIKSTQSFGCVYVCVYRYPTDRVPAHTRSKLRQEVGRVTTRCCVSHGTGPCHPIRKGSGVVTCPVAPDPVYQHWRVPCRRASCDSGSRLPAQEGFRAATRPAALEPDSPHGRVLALPRVPQLSVGDE